MYLCYQIRNTMIDNNNDPEEKVISKPGLNADEKKSILKYDDLMNYPDDIGYIEFINDWGFQLYKQTSSWNFGDLASVNTTTDKERGYQNGVNKSEEDVDSKISEFYDESNIVKVERTWGSYDYPTFPILGGYWANGHSVGEIVSSSPINDLQPTGNLGNSDSYNYDSNEL